MFFTGYCQLLKHWSSRSQSIKYHSLRKHTYSTVSVDAKYRTCSVQQSLANYSTSKDATEAEENANETEEPEVEVTGISNPFAHVNVVVNVRTEHNDPVSFLQFAESYQNTKL